MGDANPENHESYFWSYAENWYSSLNLRRQNQTNYYQHEANYQRRILLSCFSWCSWLLLRYVEKNQETSTLCYWSYICLFSSPAENDCNVVFIGQFYRYYHRRCSSELVEWYLCSVIIIIFISLCSQTIGIFVKQV